MDWIGLSTIINPNKKIYYTKNILYILIYFEKIKIFDTIYLV